MPATPGLSDANAMANNPSKPHAVFSLRSLIL
jgi:hypothetical protein